MLRETSRRPITPESTLLDRRRKVVGVVAVASWGLALAMAVRLTIHPKGAAVRHSLAHLGFLAGAAGLALLLTAAWISGGLRRRLFQLQSRLALSLAASLLTLLIAELALRALNPLGLSYFDESKRYQLDKIPDPTLVYRNPVSVERTYFGHTTRFNELGLRGPALHPKSGAFRILALGDSVTQGLAVAEADTWVSQLATLCSRGGGTIETLNAGTGGYNTIQEDRFLAQHMKELDPDLLVLMFVENDVDPLEGSYDPSERSAFALGALAERLWLYRLFRIALTKHHGGLRRFQRDDHWSESLRSLRDIARRCKEADASLVTFLWRWEPSPKTDALHEDLSALAKEAGFLYCDVLPWFTDKDLPALRVSPIDSHPNVQGHTIAAQGIEAFIREHHLIRR